MVIGMTRLFVVALFWSGVFVDWTTTRGEGMECKRTICRGRVETLECPGSQILVGNVTTSSGQRDDVMLQGLKRLCMGRASCNLGDVCKQSRDARPRTVSFLCVDPDKVEDNTCTRVIDITALHGFLQSPGYPATTQYRPCHWRIEPEPSAAVHLALHDLDYQQRTRGVCDGGLHLKTYTCDFPRRPYEQMLCANESGRDEGVRVVSCGAVEVQLRIARYAYPLRFWISYTVKDSVVKEPVFRALGTAGLVGQCPPESRHAGAVAPPGSMFTADVEAVTSASGGSDGGKGESDKDSTLTVLIVLVCVIGSIAAALSVILIVVCLRRRRPKVELIEHVYALPGPCEPLSHTPLNDHAPTPKVITPPPPRPKLIEQYSDVADAVPNNGRDVTPASPGYAEVEEVCDVNSDDVATKRFQFRQRKQPSVSSTSNSTTYEDVNPLPFNANGTVQNSDSKRDEKDKKKQTADKASREIPVYVHVVDSPEQTLHTDHTAEKQNHNKDISSSGIAPLAAKFSGSSANSNDIKSTDKRGKTGLYSTRLYPLQEGRVASLVSTLDRGQLKKNTKSGVHSNHSDVS